MLSVILMLLLLGVVVLGGVLMLRLDGGVGVLLGEEGRLERDERLLLMVEKL